MVLGGALMVHAYNPRYLTGLDPEDSNSRSAKKFTITLYQLKEAEHMPIIPTRAESIK
jgi:hypothetical protein